MNFELVASEIFLEQIKELSDKCRRQIKKKLDLIKLNPFRFKSIHSQKFSRVFRIRLNIEGQEARLIYVVLGNKIILACLLDRSKEYKDLENYLAKVQV